MKGFAAVFISIGLLLLTGCSQEEPAYKVDLDKRKPVIKNEETDVITYAYLPQYSHKESYQRHHLLVEYLRRETGLNIKQIFPDTFDKHMEMVGQGKIDISFSNPFVYVKIAHRYGAMAFARILEANGNPHFRGQIICRADNRDIEALSDCRGKRWIAVDPSSAGGYLFQLGYFISRGIQKEDFIEIAFSPGPGGKQEKVVLSIWAKKYDLGSIREGTLNVIADRIDIGEIRVFAHTPWYPGWTYAARKGLVPETVSKVRQALLQLNYSQSDHRRIMEAADITGIISSKDQDFNPVRELAAQIGMRLEDRPK
ncbi:MAG: phosphate/phosphite/phosphonate ABC transporter substrate-binding protein [Desulfosarcina sp.]|nr:phosphate/phosphite/phosphonate ABC transporter substrate-binding protein [Desulfosarcina sp.]MBC2744918.1 phosphate/phosphite/phosphonate ABC transporter substrate-binding protein [Desulfosarcina sp.]MBC2767826.1 phosphate/phosphite/phosphonate ABC transporter substrate-binding protein [Desulfosarcina sp.]